MIDDQSIPARIARFPLWHYDFDLRGHRTNPAKAAWGQQRFEYFMKPVIEHYGGSLAGKRVVDLGCNAGFFALKAVEAGCNFVLGIDGRQMHIDQANVVFDAIGVDPRRYEFACANIVDFDYRAYESFDLVLCLGVLYHLDRPISLLKAIAESNTDLLVIETALSTARGSFLELRRENPAGPLNAVDSELVMFPTAKAVLSMAELVGYDAKLLALPPPEEPMWAQHRYGLVQAFICAKGTDLSEGTAFEFRTLRSLYRDQDRWAAFANSHSKKERKEVLGKVGPASEVLCEPMPASTASSALRHQKSRMRRWRRCATVWLPAAVRAHVKRRR